MRPEAQIINSETTSPQALNTRWSDGRKLAKLHDGLTKRSARSWRIRLGKTKAPENHPGLSSKCSVQNSLRSAPPPDDITQRNKAKEGRVGRRLGDRRKPEIRAIIGPEEDIRIGQRSRTRSGKSGRAHGSRSNERNFPSRGSKPTKDPPGSSVRSRIKDPQKQLCIQSQYRKSVHLISGIACVPHSAGSQSRSVVNSVVSDSGCIECGEAASSFGKRQIS